MLMAIDVGNTNMVFGLLEGKELVGSFRLMTDANPVSYTHLGLGEIALGFQVLVRGVPMALGHLVLGIPHDGGTVNVGGNFPPKGLVEQVILGRGGEVFACLLYTSRCV